MIQNNALNTIVSYEQYLTSEIVNLSYHDSDLYSHTVYDAPQQ